MWQSITWTSLLQLPWPAQTDSPRQTRATGAVLRADVYRLMLLPLITLATTVADAAEAEAEAEADFHAGDTVRPSPPILVWLCWRGKMKRRRHLIWEDLNMAFYLYQLSYSKDAVKAMVANPSDREAAARKLIEALGAKLHHLFFAFGEYDVICLIEAPDDMVMMAGAAAVASAGTVSGSSTIKLMTAAEAMAAMTLAGKVTGAYKPPHS